MLPEHPVAYLITWTLKGIRVHGDAAGSVDRTHNVYGTPRLAADPERSRRARALLSAPLAKLEAADRALVERTIHDVAAHRGRAVHALAVRSNHVHVVIDAGRETPERVMNDLKAWLTRRLREAGRLGPDDRPWTRHGSTRYLWNEAAVAAAVRYVEEGQDMPRE